MALGHSWHDIPARFQTFFWDKVLRFFKIPIKDYKELRPMDHSFFYLSFDSSPSRRIQFFPFSAFFPLHSLALHVLHSKCLIQCKMENVGNIQRPLSVEQFGGHGKHSHPKGDWMQYSGPHYPLYSSIFSKARSFHWDQDPRNFPLLFVLE